MTSGLRPQRKNIFPWRDLVRASKTTKHYPKERAMKKQNYAGKTIRVLAASLLAAGLAFPSGAAFAKTTGANDVDDASFTLTGLAQDDVVHFYQIIDTDIDTSNNLKYKINATGLPAEYDTVEEIAAKYAETDGGRTVADAISAAVIASVTSTDVTVGSTGQITQNLDSGYYLVTVTSNSGNTKLYQTLLVDATPDVNDGAYATRTLAETAIKVEVVPAPTKQIIASDDATTGQSTDTYSVGDTAKFVISGTVPSYPADATYATYSITDVPDAGLSVDTTNLVVKDATGTALTKDTDYTLATNSGGGFTVAFTKGFVLKHPGQKVTINYSATINSVDLVSGKVGNKVYGKFNPNPYEDKDVKTEEKDPWDQTYGFSFKKLGKQADGSTAALPGAEFTITDKKTGSVVTYIDASGTLHSDGKVTSGADGWVYVNGLEAGTYTVTETKVPTGYQKVDPFDVELNSTVAKDDSNATEGKTESNFTNLNDKVDPKAGQLPTTGGAGTIALTAGGILLVVGGSAVLLRTRRRNETDAQ